MLKLLLLSSLFFSTIFHFVNKVREIDSISHQIKLSPNVKETSGLIYYLNDIWTINDSGDKANLYRISLLSGQVIQTVHIKNAKNIDWEDISQDETHIYIGDTGNNNGNKDEFRIYKIRKSQIPKQLTNTSINAEIISFRYEDQTNGLKPYKHNFDCEAIINTNHQIGLFTKNWASGNTNYYIIDEKTGIAKKKRSFKSNGLITGSEYDLKNDAVYLVGYNYKDDSFFPFLMLIENFSTTKPHIQQFKLSKLNHFQVEGICLVNGEVFISNEETSYAPPSLYKICIR